MALMPKRIKFRKQQRGSMKGKATRGNFVAFGEFGLQALETQWVTARQIEAGRVAATHYLRRQGKVYIRIFPDKPISKKPLETRMGKGKRKPGTGRRGLSRARCSTRLRACPMTWPRRRWPEWLTRCRCVADSWDGDSPYECSDHEIEGSSQTE